MRVVALPSGLALPLCLTGALLRQLSPTISFFRFADLHILHTTRVRAGFDTRYLQVSRYFDTDILRFSILPGIELRFFGTSVLRYFDISPDLDLSLNSDSIPF